MYNVTPKFVNFRLYKKSLQKKTFYKDWQTFLIRNELVSKEQAVENLRKRLMCSYECVRAVLSFIDLNHVLHYIHRNVDRYKNQVTITHAQKLYKLGAFYRPPTVCSEHVITNLSNKLLSKR